MAYTPVNWQTGETISAARLNKMDNGWSIETARQTLCNESITTEGNEYGEYSGGFVFDSEITAPAIVVTFNNVEYTCDAISMMVGYAYGGYTESGVDFSEYPFAITSTYLGNGLYTETAGTYSVKIETETTTTEISSNFQNVVNAVVAQSGGPMQCVVNETASGEAQAALNNGRLLYFVSPIDTVSNQYRMFLIHAVGRPCTIIPTNENITATFDIDTGLFKVNIASS